MKKDLKKKWRKKYPMKATFQTLKYNAARRGKEFDLTFEQFQAFAIRTKYMQKRGVEKESYHIDRIDERKGYTIDNIQVLSNIQNVRKYLAFKDRDQDGTVLFEVKTNKREVITNCPF